MKSPMLQIWSWVIILSAKALSLYNMIFVPKLLVKEQRMAILALPFAAPSNFGVKISLAERIIPRSICNIGLSLSSRIACISNAGAMKSPMFWSWVIILSAKALSLYNMIFVPKLLVKEQRMAILALPFAAPSNFGVNQFKNNTRENSNAGNDQFATLGFHWAPHCLH